MLTKEILKVHEKELKCHGRKINDLNDTIEYLRKEIEELKGAKEPPPWVIDVWPKPTLPRDECLRWPGYLVPSDTGGARPR